MLRPLRLKRFNDEQQDVFRVAEENERDMKDRGPEETGTVQETDQVNQTGSDGRTPGTPLAIAPITSVLSKLAEAGETPEISGVDMPPGEEEARHLLRRTPASYLLNQSYGLWVYISLFILTLIITRKVSVEQYGVYAVASAAFNTIAYIVAFGLEDATTTFVPRLLAEHGRAAAALLIRRLLAMRLVVLGISMVILLFGMPTLATLIGALPIPHANDAAAGLRDPGLLKHITPIAFFVLANGIAGLLSAVCAAIMRMRIVFIVGSLAQLLLLVLGFTTLQMGWGIDSILWLQAFGAFLNAAAFIVWLAPLIVTPGAKYKQPLMPVINLGLSAWFANLLSGALFKQVSIILLGVYGVALTQIAFFNLSFSLAHAANLLLVQGFGGVGGAALAAAFVGKNYGRLARIWQALVKIETLLAAPGLIFCLFNAQSIALALYGSNFAPVGPLFAIFLSFNIIVRVLGTTIHQSTLYVMGKPRLVVLGQWVGLIALVGLDILLIPHWGPAGALMGDGISQIILTAVLLAFLWRDLPEKYPLNFTLKILLATALAALPGLFLHPSGKVALAAFGCLFIALTFALLVVLKPLSKRDAAMIEEVRPGLSRYVKLFARN